MFNSFSLVVKGNLMQSTVTFRHMKTSDQLKEHATDRMVRLKKYIAEPVEAHIVLGVERHLHKAEVHMWAHGMLVRGQESSNDMYNSIDRAIEKLENQLRRYHNKLTKHKPRGGVKRRLRLKTFDFPPPNDDGNYKMPENIVETRDCEARPMMLDEAVMQMDLQNEDVLVFLNASSNEVNVIYRKKGHKFGLIEMHAH